MKRLHADDVAALETRLDASLELDRGENYQTAVERLEPKLTALRAKGASYRELAHMLTEAGMPISAVTLRVYLARAQARNRRKRPQPSANAAPPEADSRKEAEGLRHAPVRDARVTEAAAAQAGRGGSESPASRGTFRAREDTKDI